VDLRLDVHCQPHQRRPRQARLRKRAVGPLDLRVDLHRVRCQLHSHRVRLGDLQGRQFRLAKTGFAVIVFALATCKVVGSAWLRPASQSSRSHWRPARSSVPPGEDRRARRCLSDSPALLVEAEQLQQSAAPAAGLARWLLPLLIARVLLLHLCVLMPDTRCRCRAAQPGDQKETKSRAGQGRRVKPLHVLGATRCRVEGSVRYPTSY
jgi:hypothetical protein